MSATDRVARNSCWRAYLLKQQPAVRDANRAAARMRPPSPQPSPAGAGEGVSVAAYNRGFLVGTMALSCASGSGCASGA